MKTQRNKNGFGNNNHSVLQKGRVLQNLKGEQEETVSKNMVSKGVQILLNVITMDNFFLFTHIKRLYNKLRIFF